MLIHVGNISDRHRQSVLQRVLLENLFLVLGELVQAPSAVDVSSTQPILRAGCQAHFGPSAELGSLVEEIHALEDKAVEAFSYRRRADSSWVKSKGLNPTGTVFWGENIGEVTVPCLRKDPYRNLRTRPTDSTNAWQCCKESLLDSVSAPGYWTRR